MKILYITNGINGPGGLERVLSIKASWLAEQYGYEVHILVLNDAHVNLFFNFSPKIRLHSIAVSGNPIRYWNAYRRGIKETVCRIQPDIISVCDDGLKGFFIPWFLKTDASLIYERHTSKLTEINDRQSGLKKWMIKGKWVLMELLAKRFSRFIVLTEGNTQEWKSLKNIEVIPNPLTFFPDEQSDLGQKRVICVGKVSYSKGQDTLLKVWESVHHQHPDWILELYGREDLGYLDTRNLKNNIYLYPPVKDIQEKYLQSSIYAMSSRFEGFGMVLIEAMACGVPCVSFNCPAGPANIITDNHDGFLVPPGNVGMLSERIVYLIENEGERKRLGWNARETAKKYLPENVIPLWNELFVKLREVGK